MSELSPLLEAAFTCHKSGDLVETARLYKDILQKFPLQPDALHMLGIVAKQQGNNELALKLIEVALGQRTEMPLGWHNRALILRLLGRHDEALQSAEQAVNLDPTFAEAWDMIGFLLRGKGEYERAREAHAHAVDLCPNNLQFMGNYALLLLATGELAQAYTILRAAEAQDKNYLSQTMGNVLKAAGYPELAIPYYRASRERYPDNDEVRITEAMTHLQMGDFAEGWKLWETRPSLDPRFQHVPFWHGQPVEHLLVHEDQGLGDAIQFARYIPELRNHAKHITVQVTSALKRLFETSFFGITFLTLDDPVPAVDARIRLLSLPAILGTNGSNIPAPIPYIHPSSDERKTWRAGLIDIPKPQIGVVWGGNPNHLNDALRSIPLKKFLPIIQCCKNHMISLQKGSQKAGVIAATGILDTENFLRDFADTAALIAELDLLITVDTSVAHLAGAMGKPVWLLLPFDPDWRWLLGREDTPWYPSMRLFRQKEPRNWQDVIERVINDLKTLLARDKSVLQPKPWQAPNPRQNPDAITLQF